MFPYFETAAWHPQPFATLLAIAIAVGYFIGVRRAARQNVSRERISELALLVMFAGFVGAHFMKLAYAPGAYSIWNPFGGIASFGAFGGALLGGLFFFWRHSIPVPLWFIYSDAGAFAAPFAWAIGRLGCYLVHDHPGIATTSWLGVQYPGGTRFDLGLLEMLFLILLGAVFLVLDRRKHQRGFYCTIFLLAYGAFRWALDGLHADPPRYGGWSVDRIAATLMMAAGVACILEMRRLRAATISK